LATALPSQRIAGRTREELVAHEELAAIDLTQRDLDELEMLGLRECRLAALGHLALRGGESRPRVRIISAERLQVITISLRWL
jgi:hypothetical protein